MSRYGIQVEPTAPSASPSEGNTLGKLFRHMETSSASMHVTNEELGRVFRIEYERALQSNGVISMDTTVEHVQKMVHTMREQNYTRRGTNDERLSEADIEAVTNEIMVKRRYPRAHAMVTGSGTSAMWVIVDHLFGGITISGPRQTEGEAWQDANAKINSKEQKDGDEQR